MTEFGITEYNGDSRVYRGAVKAETATDALETLGKGWPLIPVMHDTGPRGSALTIDPEDFRHFYTADEV